MFEFPLYVYYYIYAKDSVHFRTATTTWIFQYTTMYVGNTQLRQFYMYMYMYIHI